jgi:ribosomal protein S18 acetylase RimI-like enzyme
MVLSPASPSSTVDDDTVLDNPAWHALNGADRALASNGGSGPGGKARRYRPAVSPIAAVANERDPAAWAELAALADGAPLAVICASVPEGWTELQAFPLIQMVHTGALDSRAGGYEFAPLGPADVPDMLALVAATEPGPFAPETIAFGGYRGWRADGELACMAGERMHPGNWTEVSAVCTAPGYQGRGLAGAVVSVLVSEIAAAGRRPFLHVTVENPARRLYERLGFAERARCTVRVLQPASATPGR